MSATMVELRLTQNCYLICYDANSIKSKDIRKMIVELANVEGISEPSEFMLSESCYLIPANKSYDYVTLKLRDVAHNDDKLHILALEEDAIFRTKKIWFIESKNKYIRILYRLDHEIAEPEY